MSNTKPTVAIILTLLLVLFFGLPILQTRLGVQVPPGGIPGQFLVAGVNGLGWQTPPPEPDGTYPIDVHNGHISVAHGSADQILAMNDDGTGIHWEDPPSGEGGTTGPRGPEGPRGPQGPVGETGVVAGTFPAHYDPATKTISIDERFLDTVGRIETELTTEISSRIAGQTLIGQRVSDVEEYDAVVVAQETNTEPRLLTIAFSGHSRWSQWDVVYVSPGARHLDFVLNLADAVHDPYVPEPTFTLNPTGVSRASLAGTYQIVFQNVDVTAATYEIVIAGTTVHSGTWAPPGDYITIDAVISSDEADLIAPNLTGVNQLRGIFRWKASGGSTVKQIDVVWGVKA